MNAPARCCGSCAHYLPDRPSTGRGLCGRFNARTPWGVAFCSTRRAPVVLASELCDDFTPARPPDGGSGVTPGVTLGVSAGIDAAGLPGVAESVAIEGAE